MDKLGKVHRSGFAAKVDSLLAGAPLAGFVVPAAKWAAFSEAWQAAPNPP